MIQWPSLETDIKRGNKQFSGPSRALSKSPVIVWTRQGPSAEQGTARPESLVMTSHVISSHTPANCTWIIHSELLKEGRKEKNYGGKSQALMLDFNRTSTENCYITHTCLPNFLSRSVVVLFLHEIIFIKKRIQFIHYMRIKDCMSKSSLNMCLEIFL